MRHGIAVTRLRGVKVADGYGGETIDWSAPVSVRINNCAIAPLVEPEVLQAGQQATIEAWTLYAPHSDIRHNDRIEVDGFGLFEVDGDPGLWRSPYTGRKPGMTVRLRRITD